MPLLTRWPLGREGSQLQPEVSPAEESGRAKPGPASTLFPVCGNPACRSGWVKLWRNRQVPVFEGKWACSPACLEDIVSAAITRELGERGDSVEAATVHQHRIPLGLMLLSLGQITQEQLKKALAAQKKSRTGQRLGEWLIEQGAVDEEQVTRALSSQWNAPVLSIDQYNSSAMAVTLPRLLIDSRGALPLRLAGRRLLYFAFESRVDRCLMLAVERMSGLKVEAGLLRTSVFQRCRGEVLRASFPKVRLLEAGSMRGLVHAMTGMIEERKPVEARLLRVHDFFWLRIWLRSADGEDRSPIPGREEVEDMVCSFQPES